MSNYKWTDDGRFPIVIAVIGMLLPFGLISLGSALDGSPTSSSASGTLENRDIPGYASCVSEMMKNNPSAKQRTCCDKLGGKWSQKGSFGTCRK